MGTHRYYSILFSTNCEQSVNYENENEEDLWKTPLDWATNPIFEMVE